MIFVHYTVQGVLRSQLQSANEDNDTKRRYTHTHMTHQIHIQRKCSLITINKLYLTRFHAQSHTAQLVFSGYLCQNKTSIEFWGTYTYNLNLAYKMPSMVIDAFLI